METSFVLRNTSNGVALAQRVKRAGDPLSRGIGLLARGSVAPDEGLWIDRCAAVHTLGMRAVLDLYFLDREGHVLGIVPNVRPQRFSVACRGARNVVELGAAGDERAVRIGDRLVLE